MELQQQQQQVVQLEGLENDTARALLGKFITVLLALMAVLLVFVSTVANCVSPMMKSRSRSFLTILLFLLFMLLWRNWDAFLEHILRFLHLPRWHRSHLSQPSGALNIREPQPTIKRRRSSSVKKQTSFFLKEENVYTFTFWKYKLIRSQRLY